MRLAQLWRKRTPSSEAPLHAPRGPRPPRRAQSPFRRARCGGCLHSPPRALRRKLGSVSKFFRDVDNYGFSVAGGATAGSTKRKAGILLSVLPPDIAASLAEFEADGSGTVEFDELHAGAVALVASKKVSERVQEAPLVSERALVSAQGRLDACERCREGGGCAGGVVRFFCHAQRHL